MKNAPAVSADPPAVVVHGLAHARAAMSLNLPVTLLSAPGAAVYAGCLWWQRLLIAAGAAGPNLLDCADAPGRAIEALRLGLPGIVLACEADLFAAVARIAAAQDARLLAVAPKALDLGQRGAERDLAGWLAGGCASMSRPPTI